MAGLRHLVSLVLTGLSVDWAEMVRLLYSAFARVQQVNVGPLQPLSHGPFLSEAC